MVFAFLAVALGCLLFVLMTFGIVPEPMNSRATAAAWALVSLGIALFIFFGSNEFVIKHFAIVGRS